MAKKVVDWGETHLNAAVLCERLGGEVIPQVVAYSLLLPAAPLRGLEPLVDEEDGEYEQENAENRWYGQEYGRVDERCGPARICNERCNIVKRLAD